jgi:hypothetical protein
MHKIIRLLSIIIPVSMMVFLFASTLYLFSYSYTSLIQNLLHQIQRPDIADTLSRHYFTESKFKILRITLATCTMISLIGMGLLYHHRNAYFKQVDALADSVKRYLQKSLQIYGSLSVVAKWALGLASVLLLLRSFYYATTFYIQYDEAWNYNLFLDKQFYFSIGAYNNYPLHNLITWCLIHVFGNQVIILRLCGILIGLFLMQYLMITIQYFFKSEWLALFVTSVFLCLPVNVFYMMYARGVLLEIFFALCVMSLLIYFIHSGFSTKRMVWLSVLNMLGTYAMLSHAYFILASGLSLLLYAICCLPKLVKASMWYGVGSIAASLLALSPMILGTGLQPAFNVLWSINKVRVFDCVSYANRCSEFNFGMPYFWIFLMIGSLFLMGYYFRKNAQLFFVGLLSLLLFLLPLCIPFVTKIFPPERALGFLVVPCIALVSICCHVIAQQIKMKWILFPLSICVLVFFSLRSHTHPFLNWSATLDQQVYETYQVLQKHQIQSVYNDSRDFDYFIPGIEFYSKQKNKPIQFSSSSTQSTRYLPIEKNTSDAIVYSRSKSHFNSDSIQAIYTVDDIIVCKRIKK